MGGGGIMSDQFLQRASVERSGSAATGVSEPSAIEEAVIAGQARVLLGSIPVGVAGGIVSGFVVAWILRHQLPLHHVVVWLGGMILAHLARLGLWIIARREIEPLPDASRWLFRLRLSVFSIGLSWAALPAFLFPVDPFFQMFLAVVIAAASGAGAAQQSSDAPSAMLLMLPPVVAMAARQLLSPNPTLEATGYLALVFSGYLALVARRIHRAFLEVSRLHAVAAEQARIDPLTDLPNRSALSEHLRLALERARRTGAVVAVGYIDLDDFKHVNDVNGHAAGDALLHAVARRWRDLLRRTEVIARLGGDEFAVVIEDIGSQHPAAEIAAVCERLHRAVATPFDVAGGGQARIGMTMGIACYPADGDDPDVLLRRADAAMYRLKERKNVREAWWQFATTPVVPAVAG